MTEILFRYQWVKRNIIEQDWPQLMSCWVVRSKFRLVLIDDWKWPKARQDRGRRNTAPYGGVPNRAALSRQPASNVGLSASLQTDVGTSSQKPQCPPKNLVHCSRHACRTRTAPRRCPHRRRIQQASWVPVIELARPVELVPDPASAVSQK